MKIGVEYKEDTLMVAMSIGGEEGEITQHCAPELARLYAEVLNRCADAVDKLSKTEGVDHE